MVSASPLGAVPSGHIMVRGRVQTVSCRYNGGSATPRGRAGNHELDIFPDSFESWWVESNMFSIAKNTLTSGKIVQISTSIQWSSGSTGLGQQQAGLAVQTVLPAVDLPVGVSLKFFGKGLGGTIFASVGQNILTTKLISGLAGVPNLNPRVIVGLGATGLRTYVGVENLARVLRAYNHALDGVFLVATILASLSVLGAVWTEWKSVRGKNLQGARRMSFTYEMAREKVQK